MNFIFSSSFSYLFVCILGILLHFTYNWSDQNKIVGLFSAKNESTWEHLKLLFFPMLFLTLLQFIIRPGYIKNIFTARTIGTLFGMLFILILFYVFWGVSGRLIGFVNITIYFIGTLSVFLTEKKVLRTPFVLNTSTCLLVWLAITLIFIAFSIKAPNLGLFYDLKKHPKSI